MNISYSDLISTLAFLFSAFATIKTVRFNSRQKFLIESQEKINAIILEKEKNEAESSKKADVSASITSIGRHDKRLKIFNLGKATASNVRLSFPEGNKFVLLGDIEDKLPLEKLERHASVELIVINELGVKSKQVVLLQWDDDFQHNQEKTVYVTIY